MTYATGQTITTSEYNTFAGQVNDVWGIGSGDYGYGQTNSISTVAVSNTITATQWTTLLARTRSAANHQASSFTVPSSVSTGNTISIISPLSTDITTIRSNRLNSSTNYSDTSNPNSANASRTGACRAGARAGARSSGRHARRRHRDVVRAVPARETESVAALPHPLEVHPVGRPEVPAPREPPLAEDAHDITVHVRGGPLLVCRGVHVDGHAECVP